MPEIKEINKEIPSPSLESQIKIVDVGRENLGREPIPREISTWMEKFEQTSSSNPPQVNDVSGQPLLATTSPSGPKITLPVTRKTFISGFKKSFEDAGYWLSTQIFRFIKIKKGNVTFKSDVT